MNDVGGDEYGGQKKICHFVPVQKKIVHFIVLLSCYFPVLALHVKVQMSLLPPLRFP